MKSAKSEYILSVAIPCYNSRDYMARAIDSVVEAGYEDIQVLIINDGSTDGTGELADDFARRYPKQVSAIHQPNRGHGGAVNAGIEAARGLYLKVLDSDDWLEAEALEKLILALRTFAENNMPPDLVVANYVYEKVGARRKKVMHYRRYLPVGRDFSWEEIRPFGLTRYLMIHSLVYRLDILRKCGIKLPEHTFYVDNLFVNVPLSHVSTLHYLDIDLYRYHIGREDQSVNERVMIRRIDQQIKVNRLMMDNLLSTEVESKKLLELMLHHFEIVTAISSILLIRRGDREALDLKDQLWADIKHRDTGVYRIMRRGLPGIFVNLAGSVGRLVSSGIYSIAQRIYGFN